VSDLPLVFFGGLLGSGHCVGMCGPLAVSLGAVTVRPRANIARQLAFSVGRALTYAFLGAVLGYFGGWLVSSSSPLIIAQASVAIAAGAALVVVGVAMAGVVPRARWKGLSTVPCSAATGLKTMLLAPGLRGAVLAGMFTGFIPCGLVYAFLLKAVSSGSPLQGALTMAVFGVGTAPLLVLTGVGAGSLSVTRRQRLLKLAAWCVVVTGLVSIARGSWQLTRHTASTPSCPLCVDTPGGS
jgi:sulfite exporter TauE/SafE